MEYAEKLFNKIDYWKKKLLNATNGYREELAREMIKRYTKKVGKIKWA